MRGRGKRALPSLRNALAIALMNDARWRAQRPSGRLALLVAAADYATDDLSFAVSHGEWGKRAGDVGERTMDDLAADATGCGLLSRSRQRKPDGMLGTYSYRFDPDLLPADLAGGTTRRFGGSSCGADLAGQELQAKALSKEAVGVLDAVEGSDVGGEANVASRARTTSAFLADEERAMAEQFAVEVRGGA